MRILFGDTGRAMLCWVAAGFLLAFGAQAAVADDPNSRLLSADRDNGNWLSYGRTYAEQHFSPLDQINAATVGKLGLAWSYDIDEPRMVEATPLAVDGILYVTGGWSKLYAVDARTGKELWRYDPEVPRAWGEKACCDVVNRGVAYFDGRVFLGTLDGRLVALDAKSGVVTWSVRTTDPKQSYTITGAPRVVKGKVIIGNGGAEYGVRGYVSAYDAKTGKQVWRFYTVPGNPAKGFENPAMRMAAKTWTGEWWKYGGGGTAWDAIVYDPELDLLYVGTGNGSPWNRKIRSPGGGDNLFLSSIVALRPDTGAYVWHYQTTPGEMWDFTATQPMILADLKIGGVVRKVLMQAPKNGFFYVLDRTNGMLISAEAFAGVSWAHGVDSRGRPIEDPAARYPKGTAVLMQPGPGGAHNWTPMSFSPSTRLVYLAVDNNSWYYRDDPGFKFNPDYWNIGTLFTSLSTGPRGRVPESVNVVKLPVTSGSYLSAWDPANQKEAWRVPGKGGGTLATAGGLVFQGHGGKDLVAYDAVTGRELWRFEIQNHGGSGPIAFEQDGAEYIVMAVGRGSQTMAPEPVPFPALLPNTNRLLAFKLDGGATLPAPVYPPHIAMDPPDTHAPQPVIELGGEKFERFCGACHRNAATGPFAPDLRYSALLGDPQEWRGVVLDGHRTEMGMVSFKTALSAENVDAIRNYIIQMAQNAVAGIQDTRPVMPH